MILDIPRFKQEKLTCGPSCMQQVLAYYGKKVDLDKLLKEMRMKKFGLAVGYVAIPAIKNGFNTKLITYDFNLFDPSWFKLSKEELIKKLKKRLKYLKTAPKKDYEDGYVMYYYEDSTRAIIKFLEMGGEIEFKPLTKDILKNYLDKKIPLIAILSSTMLYKTKRLYNYEFDDIRGAPFGHYVVVSGYEGNKFHITDPFYDIPFSKDGKYWTDGDELLNSMIFWGAKVLVVEKGD